MNVSESLFLKLALNTPWTKKGIKKHIATTFNSTLNQKALERKDDSLIY